ncbi:MAG: sigma-70 family RNA polymerase sigma factor [Chloroflexi bacterium]|nr:sigma-70 family RNA polymerase sigma factor [Chloroflexota bacterium]
MKTNPDDRKVVEELVKQAQQGHQPAFAALYERYYDQIYRYVSFKCGSPTEAEDITGEVFLKMLESIHTFKWKGHPFTSWLYRIAHNQVVDNFRRKGRRQTVPLEDAKERTGVNASDLERAAAINMTMKEVLAAMDSLTDLQREVISLRFGSGLSVAETAQSVGRKDNAVKALQHAGLKKLRQAMVPVAPANFPVIEGDA